MDPQSQHKTVGTYLKEDQAAECQHPIANVGRDRELLTRLEQIGIQRLEANQPRD
jgi:hypothetical protein